MQWHSAIRARDFAGPRHQWRWWWTERPF